MEYYTDTFTMKMINLYAEREEEIPQIYLYQEDFFHLKPLINKTNKNNNKTIKTNNTKKKGYFSFFKKRESTIKKETTIDDIRDSIASDSSDSPLFRVSSI